jgi:hypothetical protein
MKSVLRRVIHDFKCCYCETEKYTFCNKTPIFHINPLCTKLIIWEDPSTCHHNKTPTEKGQLMGNPVYTWVENCSPQATLVYEETNFKICQKTY